MTITMALITGVDIALAGPRWLSRIWRRSLFLRVTATTLALSILVMAGLGFFLLSRITVGLLDAKDRASVGEAAAGLVEAQRLLDAADTGSTTPSAAVLVDSVVTALASRAGSPGQFDVLLLAVAGSVDAPERGTNLVSVESVPTALRDAIVRTHRQSWTYTNIQFLDGRSIPGLLVGGPLQVPTVGDYELYYLFPLTQERQSLDLVRSSVVVTGVLLVGLLALVAALITRQVVVPVRAAARTASRFSDGHLSERMKVQGEDDLARLANSFNAMAASLGRQIKQLEGLSRVQRRFVSDVSHELRTPLTTIRMAADVMFDERSSFNPPMARAAELLQAQLDRFELLLVDLLEISRFDAGAAVLEAEPIDIRLLCLGVVDAMAALSERSGVPLRMQAEEGDCQLLADSRRVDRIMRNLVGNAIEHGDGQGVDIRIGVSDSAVAVTVRDHGVGLRPGEASLVFGRFWRADPARARSTGGSGLGLAIALEDARLHGGWLEASGEPGHGACFRLTLPRTLHGQITISPLPLGTEETT